MKKKVFVLGNPLVKNDSLPIQILPKLRQRLPDLQFIHIDPTEEYPQKPAQDLIIIDTVLGIKSVTSFNDLNHWYRSPRVTVHDFDLPVSLGLAKKLGKIKSLKVIGVPPKGDKKKIINQIVNLLAAI